MFRGGTSQIIGEYCTTEHLSQLDNAQQVILSQETMNTENHPRVFDKISNWIPAILLISGLGLGVTAFDLYEDGALDGFGLIEAEGYGAGAFYGGRGPEDQKPQAFPEDSGPPEEAPSGVEISSSEGGAQQPNYVSDGRGLPAVGMDSVDLSGISQGGGLGPEGEHDWEQMKPSWMTVPETNLSVPVVPKGVVAHSASYDQMELPVSFQAGWLNTSEAITAHSGTTVIAGHVNWSDGSWAPMSNLYNATPGMTVITSDDKGVLTRWKVTESRDVDQHDLSTIFSLSDKEGPRRLLLITCKSTGGDGLPVFDKNHVVTAIPENN